MEVRRYADPRAFRRDAEPILMASPARSNLPLGVLQSLIDRPHSYSDFSLWLAVADDEGVGLAMQTKPHSIIIADPLDPSAIEALAVAVSADGTPSPGVVGNVPFAEAFTTHLTSGTTLRADMILRDGVFELTDVNDVPSVSGSARPAVGRDKDLIRRWIEAFHIEAYPADHPRDTERMEEIIEDRLAGRGCGFWIWDDGEAVSLAGHLDVPRVGSRIGPVYTPPEHRGRGYATRLVAELSAARLGMGDPACFLFTDLSNPTSNAIYERIGYVQVCEAEEYAFRDA